MPVHFSSANSALDLGSLTCPLARLCTFVSGARQIYVKQRAFPRLSTQTRCKKAKLNAWNWLCFFILFCVTSHFFSSEVYSLTESLQTCLRACWYVMRFQKHHHQLLKGLWFLSVSNEEISCQNCDAHSCPAAESEQGTMNQPRRMKAIK